MLRVLSLPHQMTAAPERRKMFPAPLIGLATDVRSINQRADASRRRYGGGSCGSAYWQLNNRLQTI
jgi:hypothetical protein